MFSKNSFSLSAAKCHVYFNVYLKNWFGFTKQLIVKLYKYIVGNTLNNTVICEVQKLK